ncbi:MAG TPA: Hsp20/alpha crystallin family protein [Bryobacteraceae bacterium]|nr:Hsp20/alpha crystallin family protein [Bryobacteraceae bacterium]
MMSSVLAGDVRQTLDQFRRSVDQLFENFYGLPVESGRAIGTSTGTQWVFTPAVETAWGDTALNLRVILPGVPQHDLKVNIQGNQLLIEGERKPPEGFAKNAYTQLSYGRFRTEVTLPPGLDLDKMNCQLHDGILNIHVPVGEKMRPRQIQIQTGDQRKGITA